MSTMRSTTAKEGGVSDDKATDLQNHRDDRAGVADVLRGSAGNDELQGLEDDKHNVHLHASRRQHEDHDHYHHEDRGGVSRREEMRIGAAHKSRSVLVYGRAALALILA